MTVKRWGEERGNWGKRAGKEVSQQGLHNILFKGKLNKNIVLRKCPTVQVISLWKAQRGSLANVMICGKNLFIQSPYKSFIWFVLRNKMVFTFTSKVELLLSLPYFYYLTLLKKLCMNYNWKNSYLWSFYLTFRLGGVPQLIYSLSFSVT